MPQHAYVACTHTLYIVDDESGSGAAIADIAAAAAAPTSTTARTCMYVLMVLTQHKTPIGWCTYVRTYVRTYVFVRTDDQRG